MSVRVYLSLGSNVGKREIHLRQAILQLSGLGGVIAVSSFYETEPVEFIDQAWFLNCAVALDYSGTPADLMSGLLEIERQMGRERIQKKGPRTIDLDILLFGNVMVDTADLVIPHPAMAGRRFVLQPLDEIAPDVRHPKLNKLIRELLIALPGGQVVRRFQDSAE